MKMTVVTDESGRVVGTQRHDDDAYAGKNRPKLRLQAGPKQRVREIDLPPEFENLASVDELHERLAKHLRQMAK